MKKNVLWVVVLLFVHSCTTDKKAEPSPVIEQTGKVQLVFEPYIDTQSLELYTGKYLSPANDTFQVQNFKFFVHFKSISTISDSVQKSEDYTLISFDSETSLNSVLIDGVKTGEYVNLKFDIGIDSANNHSTVHLGELAPGSGMTWDWNTGYKFLLLEGTYATLTTSGALVFHIGEDKNYKSLSFTLPSNLSVETDKTSQIRIRVNINGMFREPNLIDFDVLHEAMNNADGVKIAENYAAGMFSISEIINP